MKYLYTPPETIRRIFDSFKWTTSNGTVLLTFDDGPTPYAAEKILKTLNDINIKALFFCVGNNVRKYPELARSISKEGHALGNHTMNHTDIWFRGYEYMMDEVKKAKDVISQATNKEVEYFRPPHGRFDLFTNNKLKNLNLTNIMWSLLTLDYKNDLSIVKFAVTNYLKNNSIIVLHDNLKSEKIITDSIKFITDEVYKKDLKFGVPEECLN